MRASREGSIARAIGADPSMLESRRLFPQGGADMKRTLVVGAVIAVVLAVGFYALAQPKSEDKKEMTKSGGKQHRLAAALETVQWGWLDPKEPPKLTVDSGDVVSVETMMHSHDKVKPGITMDEIVALRKANPGGGPHSMTGPIYVNGAEPGDVMEIRILKIVPKNFAINFNLPPSPAPLPVATNPTIPWPARAASRTIRWRPSPRCGLGRTAPTWTSTSCRPGAPSTSRSSSRAASSGPATRTAVRATARST